MRYRNIETFRELRLWIERVIFPATVVTGVLIFNPNIRNKVKSVFKGQNGGNNND